MALKEFKSAAVDHDRIVIHALAFGGTPKIVKPGWLHLEREGQEKDPHLCHCFCALLGNFAVIHCGALDSFMRVDEAAMALEWGQKQISRVSEEIRISVIQLDVPEADWEAIELEQWILLRLKQAPGINPSYINLASPFFFLPIQSEEPTPLQQKMIHKLSRQINGVSWLQYTDWMEAEMRQLLNSMPYGAAEEYQLEAAIEDFIHEVESMLLKNYRKEAHEAIQVLGNAEFGTSESLPDYQMLIEMQKKSIKLNRDIFSNLQRQSVVLNEIASKISLIESHHPEMQKIKYAALLLSVLLESQSDDLGTKRLSWGKQLLMQFLLDAHFGVMCLLNCSHNHERSVFAFAVKISVLQVLNQQGFAALFELAMHWNETVLMTNQLFSEESSDGLESLRKQPKLEAARGRHMAALVHLRHHVLGNLHALALPHPTTRYKEVKVSSEYLNFLPPHVILDKEVVPLVHYDNSGMPTQLSEKGLHLMARMLATA